MAFRSASGYSREQHDVRVALPLAAAMLDGAGRFASPFERLRKQGIAMNGPTRFDPAAEVVTIDRKLSAAVLPEVQDPGHPVDGFTLGVATMPRSAPHGGERHPDGDEVLYLISGRVCVVFLDRDWPPAEVQPGQGLVVPRGVWHRVDVLEPCQIVYLTPGPNNELRPLALTD